MKHPSRRKFLQTVGATSAAIAIGGCSLKSLQKRKPNIIFFMADDLGYNEVGCYGQQKIRTPHIDRLAAEGVRFIQSYSGSPVCAPSRCVLLTGKHTGHAYIRTNREVKPEGQLPIPDETLTIAELLKAQGYVTAAIGKWGLGPPGSEGDPLNQGFDHFFGYNCQRQAHNYYPRYLWSDRQKVNLPGNDRGLTGKFYAPDLMEEEALNFIRDNKEKPFFLYYPTPVPHVALQVPDDSLQEYLGLWDDPPYDGSKGYLPNEHPRATYAAMVTRMDRTLGRMMALLKELDLDENTIVFFTSDNGPTYVGGYDLDFFDGNGPLRSRKGFVYEGGIRVPFIVRWPGRIKPGSETEHITAFQDVMPTLMELVGAADQTPEDIDGISFVPTLTGKGKQAEHEYLYMEFPSYGGQQMVRMGDWKAVRKNLFKDPNAPIELYNLKEDIGETTDVADQHPDIVEKIREIMKSARTPSRAFPFPALDNAAKGAVS